MSTTSTPTPVNENRPTRLLSLDILRGLAMFVISGGGKILFALLPFLPSPWRTPLARQLNHLPWEGFTFFDLIFPLFIFVSGISFTLSWQRQIDRGESLSLRWQRLLRRTLLLILLGVLFNEIAWGGQGLLMRGWAGVRWFSVLGRIGVSIALAAIPYCCITKRWRWTVFPLGLLAYTGLLAWLGGPTAYQHVNAQALWTLPYDQWIVPTATAADPEGLISTFGAFLTAYAGMLIGDLLQTHRRSIPLWLTLAGALCLGIGFGASGTVPIIKFLWTPTYILVTAGWSLLLLALVYTLTDFFAFRRGWIFLTAIGAHTLLFYFLPWFFDFNRAAWRLLGGPIKLFISDAETVHTLCFHLLGYLLMWTTIVLFISLKKKKNT